MAKKIEKPSSAEELRNIELIIKEHFSSQNPENIITALSLCEEYGINSSQFSLYYNPEEDKNDENDFFPNISEHTKPTIKEIKKSQRKTEISFISLREFEKDNEQLFFDSFPYEESSIVKLSEISLVKIINGCFSSYGSRDIIRVFNPKEYLGKMSGIINLRNDPAFMNNLFFEIKQNTKTVNDLFYNIIKHLDNLAYKQNAWNNEMSKLGRNRYSVAKNEQKERINYIPEEEKKKFIDSLFRKKKDFVRNHNYSRLSTYDSRLKGTKKGYALFLIEQLNTKWNNQDTII